ncbi:uncharacterized protein LOC134652262 [Cydia amplana]|uniref:uncharacterized protein LOC134652262 n=1 Tax=Cydia amplana TaxID=1869771 RepID=UPI002FE6278B
MSQSYLGNLPIFDHKTTEWAIFKSRLTKFFLVNSISEADKKSAITITHLSDESYRLVRNLAYPKEIDSLTYDALVLLLDEHFKQKQCTFADKAKFFGAMKSAGETLSEWAARLRGLASYCDFGTALETNLRDRFVLGLGSGSVRDKLFEQKPSSLTFAKALELAEQTESAREAKLTTIKEEPVFRAQTEGGYRGGARGARGRASGSGQRDPRSTPEQCAVCGMKNHTEINCRYKSYKCQKCGKKGHLKKVCGESARVHNVSVGESSSLNRSEVDDCIDNDIEQRAGSCATCAVMRAAPARAPPASWPRPGAPFQRVHIDYMVIGSRTYLILVDAYKGREEWNDCEGADTEGEREMPHVPPAEAPPLPQAAAGSDNTADHNEDLPSAHQRLRPRVNVDFKKYF